MKTRENSIDAMVSQTLHSLAKGQHEKKKKAKWATKVRENAETLIKSHSKLYRPDDEDPRTELEPGEKGILLTPGIAIELYRDQGIGFHAIAIPNPRNEGELEYFAVNAQLSLGSEQTHNLPVFGFGTKEPYPRLDEMSVKKLKKGARLIAMMEKHYLPKPSEQIETLP